MFKQRMAKNVPTKLPASPRDDDGGSNGELSFGHGLPFQSDNPTHSKSMRWHQGKAHLTKSRLGGIGRPLSVVKAEFIVDKDFVNLYVWARFGETMYAAKCRSKTGAGIRRYKDPQVVLSITHQDS